MLVRQSHDLQLASNTNITPSPYFQSNIEYKSTHRVHCVLHRRQLFESDGVIAVGLCHGLSLLAALLTVTLRLCPPGHLPRPAHLPARPVFPPPPPAPLPKRSVFLYPPASFLSRPGIPLSGQVPDFDHNFHCAFSQLSRRLYSLQNVHQPTSRP
jgi:hypothetical protein